MKGFRLKNERHRSQRVNSFKSRGLTVRTFALISFVAMFVTVNLLHGQFLYPGNEGVKLRTNCIGFNADAEAARKFQESGRSWEAMRSYMAPVTHRVAVILAEFPADTDSLTTGRGLFGDLPFYHPDPDSARAAQGYVIRDPDIDSRSKAYYQRHMLWMAQYFDAVSGGLFTIEELDILADITPIIQLPREMGYYGDNELFGLRQTEFVRDAIVAADTLSDIDFSDYDAVMIFHAGAGEESDFGPPPSFPGDTPHDLFSSYIPLEAMRSYVGENDPEYQGVETVETDGDTFYVRNAIIVPETIIQDSIYNPSAVYLDILGIMAHEYGHELGLPDLNDTDTSTRPAVGNFGLMASGLFNSSGRLPAHPIAWCKLFLGWESVMTVTIDTSGVVLKGIELPGGGAKLIRVPISSSEYFLLENRLRDGDFDGEFLFDDVDGDNWPDLMDDDYQLEGGAYSEFDFGLPGILTIDPAENRAYNDPLLGSGVLIWHIDDEVIRNNFNPQYTDNCVNCNVFRPGIDLEEADGIQHLDSTLPASIDPGFGSPFDSYGGEVEGIKEEPNTDFSAVSSPSSESYTGGTTDISISGFRSVTLGASGDVLVDSLVAVDFSFARSVSGWPVVVQETDEFDFSLGPSIFDGNGITAADIDGDGEMEVSIVTRVGELFLWKSDGRNFTGEDREIRPFYDFDRPVRGTPALGNLIDDGSMEIVVVSEDGDVYALWWSPMLPPDPTWGALDGFPVSLGERVTSSPLLIDIDSPPDGVIDRIIVGTNPEDGSDGELFSIEPDGSVTPGWPVSIDGSVESTPSAGDLDRNGDVGIVIGTNSGFIYRIDQNGAIEWTQSVSGESFGVSPSLGDIDRDGDRDRDGISETLGDLEVVIGSLSGRIYVFTSNGEPFGVEPLDTGGTIKVPISLGDIDMDGFTEMVALVDGERKISVYRSNTSGSSINSVDHFPKYVSSTVSGDFFSHPILADLDGNGEEEIIFGTGNNVLYAYDLSSNATPYMRFPLGAKGLSSPFVGRSPGDTLALFSADERGMVYGWQLGVPASSAVISWAQEGKDNLHSSANGDSLGESQGIPVAFAGDTFIIYPNPAPGRDETNQVKVTYSLDETISDLSLDIYTISGRHYQKIVPPSSSFLQPDARHILNWDITDVPSGIYILRISIEKTNGVNDHLVKKAAVVK